MKKTTLLTAALAGAVLSGCATQAVNTYQPFQAEDLNNSVRSGRLIQKTDSFFVVNDSSSSMSDVYMGPGLADLSSATKLSVSKELLNRMNRTIPNIKLSSGLRSFGYGPCMSWRFTHLNQPVQAYSSSSFNSALSTLECSSGGTPVIEAFEAAKNDLSSASGNIALILFSDGHNYDASPIPAVQELKAQYGDRFCVYTVWVGNEKEAAGQTTLNQLANIGNCGFSTTAELISSSQGMGKFVENVFLKPGPMDSDGDGVLDPDDKCPNTPKGAIVDRVGCWAFHGVLFEFDSSEVTPDFHRMFSNAIKVLKLNPGLTVEIQGHTDSMGSAAYNQRLSMRRAAAVKKKLVGKGVRSSRLTTVGFGKSQPVTSNDTEEGRAHNRRVVFKRTDQ